MPAGHRTPALMNKFTGPSLKLRSDANQKTYTALLERRVLHLTRQNIMMRAVCECATGIPHDNFDPSEMTFDQIKEHIIEDMARGLNLSLSEARSRVEENIHTANPD